MATGKVKRATGGLHRLSIHSSRELLEYHGYFGIPVQLAKRHSSGYFAGSKKALVDAAGDMAPEFEQHRQEHIKNDPLVIGYMGSIILPFEDVIQLQTGEDLAGTPLTDDQIALSALSVGATIIGAGSGGVALSNRPGCGMMAEFGCHWRSLWTASDSAPSCQEFELPHTSNTGESKPSPVAPGGLAQTSLWMSG